MRSCWSPDLLLRGAAGLNDSKHIPGYYSAACTLTPHGRAPAHGAPRILFSSEKRCPHRADVRRCEETTSTETTGTVRNQHCTLTGGGNHVREVGEDCGKVKLKATINNPNNQTLCLFCFPPQSNTRLISRRPAAPTDVWMWRRTVAAPQKWLKYRRAISLDVAACT